MVNQGARGWRVTSVEVGGGARMKIDQHGSCVWPLLPSRTETDSYRRPVVSLKQQSLRPQQPPAQRRAVSVRTGHGVRNGGASFRLFKTDYPRVIDRFIDYFGIARSSPGTAARPALRTRLPSTPGSFATQHPDRRLESGKA